MGTQLIRLSQIKANLEEYMDFEQQLIAMFGDQNMEKFVASSEQQTFILSKPYTVGKNSLRVFVNGILQVMGYTDGYIEVNPKMIAFTEPLYEGDIVVVLRNQFHNYAALMGKERVKAYDINRASYFVTEENQEVTSFTTPTRYQPKLNQLKVYANGLLLTPGDIYDYMETSENTFVLNKTYPLGTIITSEVISGGLQVYKCYRFPYIADDTISTQKIFTLPQSYVPGSNQLKVYLNGVLLRAGEFHDYVEMDNKTVKMNYNLIVGQKIEFEIIQFTVDVFTITREQFIITENNRNDFEIETRVNYVLGESNLRVYFNGILLRAGITEDYVEVSENMFKFNYTQLPLNSIVEYEIINW